MLATVLLLGFVAVATATDLGRHKIYNWTTYPGMLTALALNAVGWVLLVTTGLGEDWLVRWLGYVGLIQCCVGWAACGSLMLICFVLFDVKGGDVKLVAMIAAFLGPREGLNAMLLTFVLAGCVGLILLVWRVGPWRLAAKVARQLVYALRLGQRGPLTDEERAELQAPLFLAPCVLAAVAVVRLGLLEWMV